MKKDFWLDALHATVEQYRNHPQKWGNWDCCQFAAECVLAMTGVDYRSKFPLYQSEAEALEIIGEHGGMAGLLSSVLGPPVPVARAMRGDIVELPGNACAVCLGVMCAGTSPIGLRFRPTADALAAWSVN